MSQKYSKIKAQTPHKGSIFSSSESSTASSRQLSPALPQIKEKPAKKSTKVFLFLSILALIASLALFMPYSKRIPALIGKCPKDTEEFNLFCVNEDEIEAVKDFCDSDYLENGIKNEKEAEYAKYCGAYVADGRAFPMLQNKANLAISFTIFVISLALTVYTSLLVSRH